jgi:hypothetical protein
MIEAELQHGRVQVVNARAVLGGLETNSSVAP